MEEKIKTREVVFISYAREDITFARRLCEALVRPESARAVNVDWESIPDLDSDWWATVHKLISEADTVLFIMTPDSVVSDVCIKEVSHAVQINKRMVVLVHRDVEEKVWKSRLPAIGKPNWYFFRESDEFRTTFESLLEALNTDLDYVRSHTYLYGRAWKWEAENSNPSYCLRGIELQEALRFLIRAEEGKKPPPTSLHTRFIEESKTNEAMEVDRLRARDLAARAELARIQEPDQPQRSLLLAVESARREPSMLSNHTLQQGLMLLVRRIAAMPHDDTQLMALSSDGNFIATATDREVRLWDAEGVHLETFKLDAAATLLALAPHGQYLVATVDGRTSIRPTAVNEAKGKVFDIEGRATSVVFTSDECCRLLTQKEWTATALEIDCRQKSFREIARIRSANDLHLSPKALYASDFFGAVWRLTDGQQVLEQKQPYTHWPAAAVSCHIHAFDSVDTKAVVVFTDGRVLVHCLNCPEEPQSQEVRHEAGPVYDAAFSPDGRFLATAGGDLTVRLWDATDFSPQGVLRHNRQVNTVAFSSDSMHLATMSGTGARIWRISDGIEIGRLPHDREMPIINVSFLPGKSMVVSRDAIGASLWTIGGGEPARGMTHSGAVGGVAFSPDGDKICTISEDFTARLWTWRQDSREISCLQHNRLPGDVEFSHDGRILMTTEPFEDSVLFWKVNAKTGDTFMVGRIITGAVRATFSNNSQLMATAGDKMVRIWALHQLLGDEGAESFELTKPAHELGHEGEVNDIAFSPDGRCVAAACRDKTLRLWNIRSESQIACLSHESAVNSVAFDSAGRYLATATSDGSVLVWNMEVEQASSPARRFAHDEGTALAVEFSSDGIYLASGGSDKTARVWDVEKSLEVARMTHPQTVLDVAFCPSEEGRLATACGDGEGRVWRWRTSDLIDEVCKRVSRNLTESEWARFVGPVPYERTFSDIPAPATG